MLAPSGQLAVAAALVLIVAVAARAMPEEWRRGPVLGLTIGGVLIGLLAGWMALRGGLGVLATPGPIWNGDLSGWPAAPTGGTTWQGPIALVLLAIAAGILLPPPWRYDVAGVAVVLATIGAPAAFDLAWWSPVLIGGMVATIFGMAAVATIDPRAALSRITVAGVVALHAAGAGLVRPWTTALALGSIVLIGAVVAALARNLAEPLVEDIEAEGMPPHLAQIGGAGVGAALLALPGATAALAVEFGHAPQVVLTAGLAASSLGLAAVAAARRQVPRRADRPGPGLHRTSADRGPRRPAPHRRPDLAGATSGPARPAAGSGQSDPCAHRVAAHRDGGPGRDRVQRWPPVPGRAGGAARRRRHPAHRPDRAGRRLADEHLSALAVFTISMLGLALTPPPALVERARSLRLARVLVFLIGLAAGGAGLAGSLATRELTLFTLGGAVGVGLVAALYGLTSRARLLGWLFASLMAQLFVLTAGLVAGLAPVWSAFGVLAVGAALQVFSATLPRLRRPEARREAATVEWSGHAAALIALALAFDSPRHIAALLAAWGAVLGLAATRPGRRPAERRILFWAVVLCEITAWWILMRVAEVALPEAYTLPFAALALLVGVLELRQRTDLSSWVAYGPALLAAFVPTLAIVLATDSSTMRQVLLLLGAVAVLVFGSMTQQQAPVIVGAVVTAIAAVHALFSLGPWLALIPVGFLLLILGASNERRRRAQERLQTALRGMR